MRVERPGFKICAVLLTVFIGGAAWCFVDDARHGVPMVDWGSGRSQYEHLFEPSPADNFLRVKKAQWKVTALSCWETDWEISYFLRSDSMDMTINLPKLPANIQVGKMVKLRKIGGAHDPWCIRSYTIHPTDTQQSGRREAL